MISVKDRSAYLTNRNARICEECAALTSTEWPGYSMLVTHKGYTKHYCSNACLSANVNTPGLPDAYRQLKVLALCLAVCIASLVVAILVK